MPSGGARLGAGSGGRRPGAGRPKGSVCKASAAHQVRVAASGLTPLDFMLNLMRDKKAKLEDRKWAAHAAAPYVHPRLMATTIVGEGGGPLKFTLELGHGDGHDGT